MNWKWTGLKGKIDWTKYQDYLDAIGACIIAEEAEKLKLLVDLPIIGVPVASTIAHFLQPNRFPIMDVRTVEALHEFGLLRFKSRDLKRFPAFMEAIHEIQRRHPRWSLREIDRALFAYHKANFGSAQESGKKRPC